jgi:hypothetical protein
LLKWSLLMGDRDAAEDSLERRSVWWREGRRVVTRYEYFIYGPGEKDHGARKVRRKLS